MLEVTTTTFEQEVLKADKTAVVDFWAPWCGPCKMLTPTLEELSQELTDVKFIKINVDEQPELARQFGVRGIPTLMFFKEGTVVKQTAGAQSKSAIIAVLEQLK